MAEITLKEAAEQLAVECLQQTGQPCDEESVRKLAEHFLSISMGAGADGRGMLARLMVIQTTSHLQPSLKRIMSGGET
jgi:hypothetical protein